MKPLHRMRNWLRALRPLEFHEPLGRALWDHLDAGRDRVIEVSRSDGVAYTIESRDFFSVRGRWQGQISDSADCVDWPVQPLRRGLRR
jgi:hypothetical protein